MNNGVRFRVALIGCGRIAPVHVQAVRAVPDALLVACCDLDESAARAFALKHGIASAYADVETMLTQSKPDVVHVLTPPGSHRALVELCARHGAHVYVEKPLASDENDARALVEAAESAHVRVCPGHNRLFDPQFLEMQRRIKAGEIGRVLSVRAEQGFGYEMVARSRKFPWTYGHEWGIYENLIPHPLYLVAHFLAKPRAPIVASFNLGTVKEAAVEEIRVLIPSEFAVGEVTLSMNAAPQRVSLEVVGTRGSLKADYVGLYVTATRHTAMPGSVQRVTAGFRTAWQHTVGSLGLILGVLTGRIQTYMGLRRLVSEFYRSLSEGGAPPVRAEDGIVTARLMEQIRSALADSAKPFLRVAHERPSPARALVTGATGFLGGHLVDRLAQLGVVTRATARVASRARTISGVEWVRCDLASEDDLRRATAGIETVLHCAAMAGPPGSLEEYEETNVRGTLRLARIAEEAGVRNFVYVSSISVYAIPPPGKRALDEGAAYDSRVGERGFYARSKLRAERALLEFAKGCSTLRVVVLRPGTIYGPGAALPIGRLELPSPFPGRPLVTGGQGIRMPLSFVDNVVDAMLAAEHSEVPSGSVFNVVDSADWTQGTVAAALAEVSGGRIRPRFVPYPLVWILMLGADVFAWARRDEVGTARYRLARTLADMRYPCVAAHQRLRWSPRVSLSEGLARALSAANESPYPY